MTVTKLNSQYIHTPNLIYLFSITVKKFNNTADYATPYPANCTNTPICKHIRRITSHIIKNLTSHLSLYDNFNLFL